MNQVIRQSGSLTFGNIEQDVTYRQLFYSITNKLVLNIQLLFLRDSKAIYIRMVTSGYHGLSDVILVGCLAYARRGFVDAIQALPAKKAENPTLTLAEEGLRFCNELFKIEKGLKAKGPEKREMERNENTKVGLC